LITKKWKEKEGRIKGRQEKDKKEINEQKEKKPPVAPHMSIA